MDRDDLSVFLRLDEARDSLSRGETQLDAIKQTQVKMDLLIKDDPAGHKGEDTVVDDTSVPLIQELSWLDRASQHVAWCQVEPMHSTYLKVASHCSPTFVFRPSKR